MKYFSTFVFFFFVSVSAFSQKKQNVYFFKDNGQRVAVKDSADFIRIVQEPDSGSTFFNVLEYYKTGNKKTVGTVSEFEPMLKFEGAQIKYFKNGNKSEISTFKNGKPVGERYQYYQNGKLKKTFIDEPVNTQADILGSKHRLLTFFDSTGVQLVENGNGLYMYEDHKTGLIESGKYLNGYKDSVWTGSSSKDDFSYTEIYKDGKFISGQSSKNGVSYTYDKPEVLPTFPSGITAFYTFVGKTFRYPAEAARRGVSGRLLLSFVVEKDGSLVEFKVLKHIGYGTGEEALAVLKKSPNWVPGKHHGVPVRVQYTLPLLLQLPR